jgi:protein phosphatase
MARSYKLTHPGKKRPLNEDAILCDDALGLYVVCDGVGGHAKGEVASNEAAEQVLGFVRQDRQPLSAFLATPTRENADVVRRLIESAVQSACYMIFGLAELDPSQRGMATTLSALLLVGDTAFLAQVGDSRIYLVRDGRARQLTEDHTLVNAKLKSGLVTADEAKTMKGKNVITRAVGHKDHVEVDVIELALARNDQFLLCSDGLHGYLLDGEIEGVLAAGPLDDVPARFIQLANERGGKDNVSVVYVTT